MNTIIKHFKKIAKGMLASFAQFPVVIGSAIAFTVITCIRISLDWTLEKHYYFLLQVFHITFAAGVFLGLLFLVIEKIKKQKKKWFLLLNILDLLCMVVIFSLLYIGAKDIQQSDRLGYSIVLHLAWVRIMILCIISFLLFFYVSGKQLKVTSIPKTFFLLHKSLFIALLYAGVLLAGSCGVAGAIEALLYPSMTEKVYMYLATFSGLFGFLVFMGALPDYTLNYQDEKRAKAQKKPHIIEILFQAILIPIFFAFSVVLLLWAVKMFVATKEVDFESLASISSMYTLGGIWLFFMVAEDKSNLAKLYKKIYPFAGFVILLFELWAFVIQISAYGLKTTEYTFLLIWIFALVSMPLLFLQKEKAYEGMILFLCLMFLFYILPQVGYHALPIQMQKARAEKVLMKTNMLKDGKIQISKDQISKKQISKTDRETLTDAILFLTEQNESDSHFYMPVWFDRSLQKDNVFEQTFGFEKEFAPKDTVAENGFIRLYLSSKGIDVSEYQWAIPLEQAVQKNDIEIRDGQIEHFYGKKESYEIYWNQEENDTVLPTLVIKKEDKTVLKEDFKERMNLLLQKNPWNEQSKSDLLYWTLENEDLKVMIVLNEIEISKEGSKGVYHYWIMPQMLYIHEK